MQTDSQPALQRVLLAIADPSRRRILQTLKKARQNGLSASDIEMQVQLSQPTVSHHMAVLQKAGLVDVKKDGLWRWYRRNDAALTDFVRKLRRSL